VANNEINDNKKQRQIAGNYDGHADAAVMAMRMRWYNAWCIAQ
jgi:hypothetical protein